MITIIKTLSILLTFLLFACKNEEDPKMKSESNKSDAKTEIDVDANANKDYTKSTELFAKEVLKESIRVHSFDRSDKDNPDFLKLFYADGLENISAYSNKNYPQKSEPNNYEHFTLFVATYKYEEDAKNCFNRIKSESKMTDSKNMNEALADRVRILTWGAKPGGMITQNGRNVFSLVETCRGTPIGGKWIDYENKFISFITEKDEDIEVLKAHCGANKYQIDKRTNN